MYLNDHSRAAFYESLGLNTTQFNRRARGGAPLCRCLRRSWCRHTGSAPACEAGRPRSLQGPLCSSG